MLKKIERAKRLWAFLVERGDLEGHFYPAIQAFRAKEWQGVLEHALEEFLFDLQE